MHVVGLNLTETSQGLSLMDGAAALVSEHGIQAAIAEERLVRKKYAGGVGHAVRYLLESCDLTLDQVDSFAVSICCDVPPTPQHALKVLASQGLPIPPNKLIVHHSHHLVHAASAYFTSPFEEAIIFVTDNEGNVLDPVQPNYQANCNERTSYYLARGQEIALIDRDASGPGDWGLGKVYGAATQWFGYPSYQHAGQFMGAAAYGDADRFSNVSLFQIGSGGQIVALVEPLADKALAMRRAIFRQTAEQKGAGVDIGWNRPESVYDPSQMQFDVAYLMQSELERVAVRRIGAIVKRTGVQNLVVAGGVGLNCIMNKRLLEATGIKRIFVPPCPGDDGQSIGSALLALAQQSGHIDRDSFLVETAYLGRAYSDMEIASQLEAYGQHLKYQLLPTPELLARAARYLADGRIVSWFQGRSEFGPRALGNRSILANPCRAETKDLLNRCVKHREWFRPFCPSVLAEHALEYFDTNHSPFMNVASAVRASKQAQIPAVVHKDGTARLQTVRAQDNPRYHGLIREFYNITGIPLLLNTSFNNQEPIVESPDDALRTFLKIDVDYLVMGDYLVYKRGTR